MTKRKMRSADEYDAFTKWRRVLLWRPGERKAIKRRANRRDRRVARREDKRARILDEMWPEEGHE